MVYVLKVPCYLFCMLNNYLWN